MPIMVYYDNTRISTYRDCPRKYFLRHGLDLVREGDRVELIFGSAWHESMNTIWTQLSSGVPHATVVKEAWKAFVHFWLEKGLPEPNSDNYQNIVDKYPIKNPYVALEMLDAYATQRGPFIKGCTAVEAEKPFAVPLGMTVRVPKINIEDGTISHREEEVFYIGRLDKVISHREQGRLIVEHKTTGWYAKDSGFRSDYIESFSPNSQVDGYLFAGNSLYDPGPREIWVDAALTHKTVHDKFKFIPINRQFAQLDNWLAETKEWVRRIVLDTERYEADDGKQAMVAFPKNTGSCHTYGGCTYRDVCKYMPDPRTIGIPSGFRVERWEPFDLLKIGEIMNKKGI
jgi:hypothetical protein